MTEDMNKTKPEPDIEPVKETKKVDPLKCPEGFPQKKWESWSDSAKRNYLKVVYGGKQ